MPESPVIDEMNVYNKRQWLIRSNNDILRHVVVQDVFNGTLFRLNSRGGGYLLISRMIQKKFYGRTR